MIMLGCIKNTKGEVFMMQNWRELTISEHSIVEIQNHIETKACSSGSFCLDCVVNCMVW